jgi:hypothetical protein
MFIAKQRDAPERVKKIFSMISERVLKMGSHRNGFLKLKCLSPLKMLTSPLFEGTFGAFFLLRLLRTWGF